MATLTTKIQVQDCENKVCILNSEKNVKTEICNCVFVRFKTLMVFY